MLFLISFLRDFFFKTGVGLKKWNISKDVQMFDATGMVDFEWFALNEPMNV